MAYYEMMPAGLPAGLQSGMDSVLNKKFGTSTSYAPGTWPDTVNLMGPLPEKTVSGAVAAITDGADAVPCKNVVATIAPTLTGVSSVTVTQTDGNEPPIISETYTAQLGRTVYGGTADIVNGTGNNTHYAFAGTDLQTIGISSTTSNVIVFQAYFSVNGLPNGVNGSIISNNFDKTIPSGQAGRMVLSSNILYFVIARNELQSEDANGAKQWFIDNPTVFVYEKTTPTDFTFTGQEIDTLLGVNDFSNNAGDTSVTYRRDIDLALAGT